MVRSQGQYCLTMLMAGCLVFSIMLSSAKELGDNVVKLCGFEQAI